MHIIEKTSGKKVYDISRIFTLMVCFVLSGQVLMAQDTLSVEMERLPGTFRDISSLYITPVPHLFVVEQGRDRILRLNLDGQRLDSLGRTGSGNYQFDQPIDIDATNELKIFVSDYNNSRIQVFDRRFQYLSTVRLPRLGNMRNYRPTVLTVNNLGELFFFDEENEYIYKFNFNGGFEQRFSTRGDDQILNPSSMLALDDAIFIASPEQRVVHFMTVNGRYLGFIAGFENLSALAGWDTKVFIVDGNFISVYGLSARYYGSLELKNIPRVKSIAVHRDVIIATDGRHLYRGKRPSLR